MSDAATPLISAIVVVFNTNDERLHRCLSAARSSVGVRVEIILVDNGSAQPTTNPLADRTVRRARNGGFAAGVNDGIRAAAGDYIVILNDDAVVAPNALERCVAALIEAPPECLAAAPKVLFPDLGNGQRFIDSAGVVIRPNGEAFSAGAGQPDLGQFDRDRTVLGPCFSAAVFRRAAFSTVGMLDERYFLYYEDVDWALRCFLSGHDTLFVRDAIVYHEHAASTRALGERRRFRMVQRNLLLCVSANLSLASVRTAWSGRLRAAAAAAVRGPDRTSLPLAVAAAAVRTPALLLARRRNRARARRPEADAFAFAEGLRPFIDVQHYRPNEQEEAASAAYERLSRSPGSR